MCIGGFYCGFDNLFDDYQYGVCMNIVCGNIGPCLLALIPMLVMLGCVTDIVPCYLELTKLSKHAVHDDLPEGRRGGRRYVQDDPPVGGGIEDHANVVRRESVCNRDYNNRESIIYISLFAHIEQVSIEQLNYYIHDIYNNK